MAFVRDIPLLPRTVWRLLKDRRVALAHKVPVVLAVVYLLLPAEMIPDRAFGVLGYAEDIVFLALAVAWLLVRAPVAAVEEARGGSRGRPGKP